MTLETYFQNNGQSINMANPDDHVKIVFPDPPENATEVVLKIIETAEKNEKPGERVLLTHRGEIVNKEFIIAETKYHYNPKDPRRSPTIWIETGQHPSYNYQMTLPDDRDEGGRFDLRIEVQGNVNGKKESFKGTSVLHVYYPMDVMIIPDSDDNFDTEHHALRVIRTWARQWKAFAPATRGIVGMKVDTSARSKPVIPADYQDFHKAFEKAARMSHGGIIALAVGHGSGDTSHASLVPEDRLNNDLWGRLFINKSILIDGLEPAEGQPRHIIQDPEEIVKLNALSRLGEILNGIEPRVSELRFQTCRTGADTMFLGMIADRVRVPVSGHTDFLDYDGVNPTYCHYGEDTSGYEIDKNVHEWLVEKLVSPVRPYLPPPERQDPHTFTP
jgi:hypothetical protein